MLRAMTGYAGIGCVAVVFPLLLRASITAVLFTLLLISIIFHVEKVARRFEPWHIGDFIRRNLI